MLTLFRKIFDFAGSRRGLLGRSILYTFVGALFAALQFAALFVSVNALVSGELGSALWLSALIMVLSVAGKSFFAYRYMMAYTETGYCMVAEKRVHIGNRLRSIPLGYFDDNNVGRITAVVTTTLSDVENMAARCCATILGGLITSCAFVLALCAFDMRIGLVGIAGIAVYLVVTDLSQRHTRTTGPARQAAQESLVEAVLEYVQGMGVVKSFGLSSGAYAQAARSIEESCDKNLRVERSAVPWMGLQSLVVRVASVAMAVCTLVLYGAGEMTLANCLVMTIAAFMVFQDLENAGNMSSMLQMLGASLDTANALDDTPLMDTDGRDLTPSDASIAFENVSFSYGRDPVLDHVTFSVPEKTTCAIVGPSGSGKTTLASLAARFWDASAGDVRVGGRDVRDYTLDSLMRNISLVFQDVYLFQDTIENNIRFGRPDATRDEVTAAARAACCHDFISALPEGYDTVVGEGGGSLSGGEKQRISIARALLKDAPIIILDEATANVDPENEAELQAAIEALTHNKTIMMIAHRLKTVQHADQIVVLEKGRIVQRGTHAQLVGKPGLYTDFLNARKEAISWKLA